MPNHQSAIDQKKAEIAALEAAQREWDALPESYKLATTLHSKFCHWNHTDGCGWGYETWENPGPARTLYVEKAQEVMEVAKKHNLSMEALSDLLEVL
jgi:hypothetical protein